MQEVLQDEIKKRETSSESFMKELGKALSVVCDVSYNNNDDERSSNDKTIVHH